MRRYRTAVAACGKWKDGLPQRGAVRSIPYTCSGGGCGKPVPVRTSRSTLSSQSHGTSARSVWIVQPSDLTGGAARRAGVGHCNSDVLVDPLRLETKMDRREKKVETPKPDQESPKGPEEDRTVPRRGPRQPRPYADLVDDTLDDSFPASDPPSWAGK